MHLREFLPGYVAAIRQDMKDQAWPDGRKLKGISYKQQARALGQRPHQPVNKNDVQHRRFIDHDKIVAARREPALFDLVEDGGYGKSIPAGGLADSLRGAAGECHLNDAPAPRFHGGAYGFQHSGLADPGAAMQDAEGLLHCHLHRGALFLIQADVIRPLKRNDVVRSWSVLPRI
jgi:hypothetical protein